MSHSRTRPDAALTPTRSEPRPGGRLRIRQIRSGIGYEENQKATLRALGLARLDRVVEVADTRQVRGMIATIPHLLQVEEIEG